MSVNPWSSILSLTYNWVAQDWAQHQFTLNQIWVNFIDAYFEGNQHFCRCACDSDSGWFWDTTYQTINEVGVLLRNVLENLYMQFLKVIYVLMLGGATTLLFIIYKVVCYSYSGSFWNER